LDVDLKDLAHLLLKSTGAVLEIPEGTAGVGFASPLMGWSWAVCLAHWTLEDLLESSLAAFRASSRLSYRVAIPQFSEDRLLVHWAFIDDVGAILLGPELDSECGAARAVGEQLKAELAARGFGYHKDEYASTACSLGHEIQPQGFGVRASRSKLWEAAGATEFLLRTNTYSCEALSSIVGLWTWLQMVTRSALSVWCRIYAFMRTHEGSSEEPDEILRELQCALHLSPL
jgi:hypothetical protein